MLKFLEQFCKLYKIEVSYFNENHLKDILLYDRFNNEITRTNQQLGDDVVLHISTIIDEDYFTFRLPNDTETLCVIGPWTSLDDNVNSSAPVIDLTDVLTTFKYIFNELFVTFHFVHLQNFQVDESHEIKTKTVFSDKTEIIKARYEKENQLMAAISQGNLDQALQTHLMSRTSAQQDFKITLRDRKSYVRVLAFLARKAAENGGVDVISIHHQSRYFSHKIEELNNEIELKNLGREIITRYCSLVQQHAYGHYSPTIQTAISNILSNLTTPLSLNVIAEWQYINPSYLSKLFKQETGITLTDFINEKRINSAKSLLTNSSYGISDVALAVGYQDSNYFSRMFKRQTGLSPKAYRNSQKNN